MEENILNAIERNKQSGRFREKGFVAGVVYGDGITSANSVKFETIALNKVLARHGSNAKVCINYNDSKKLGFIKEVQREALSGLVTHIDVQIVSKDHEIKLQIPIIYKGEDFLALRQLQLQVHKAEITVSGTMDLMPDAIHVNVSDMKLGDTITLSDLNLDQQLNVSEKDNAVYASISEPVNVIAETQTK